MGEISIRRAAASDFDFFYSIKCDADNIYWSGHTSPPSRENLVGFFSSGIQNPDIHTKRTIFIVEEQPNNNRVGYLYFDPVKGGSAEISIAIMQEFSGRGYGRQAVRTLCDMAFGLGFNKITAMVREDNLRSQRMFRHAGFETTGLFTFQFIDNLNKEVKMLEFKKVRQV